mgnify:CR=1 FL=1
MLLRRLHSTRKLFSVLLLGTPDLQYHLLLNGWVSIYSVKACSLSLSSAQSAALLVNFGVV